eukprot:g38282.t1
MDIGQLENAAGEAIIGNKEMAEELNKYFASVFKVKDMSNIPKIQEHCGAEVSMVAITKEKLLERLKGLKVYKTPGPDGPHPRVLKEIAEVIVEALVVIFQESLESRRVPQEWKFANVTPLFKKGYFLFLILIFILQLAIGLAVLSQYSNIATLLDKKTIEAIKHYGNDSFSKELKWNLLDLIQNE